MVLSDTSWLTLIVLTFVLNSESTSRLLAIFLHGRWVLINFANKLDKYHPTQLTGSLGDMHFVLTFPMLLYRFLDF